MLKADSSIKYASAPLNGTQKIVHQEMPAVLDPNAVHAMSGSYAKGERLGFFWVPERNRTTGDTASPPPHTKQFFLSVSTGAQIFFWSLEWAAR